MLGPPLPRRTIGGTGCITGQRRGASVAERAHEDGREVPLSHDNIGGTKPAGHWLYPPAHDIWVAGREESGRRASQETSPNPQTQTEVAGLGERGGNFA